MIDKSIVEVFGEKSQDGDKVKGLLLNALMGNSYKGGGFLGFGKKEKKEATVDLVNHPPHYNKGGMEVIEVIELVTGGKTGGKRTGDQGFVGYLLGNILKYLLRFEHKGKPIEDLKKARWYLDKLISVVSKQQTP